MACVGPVAPVKKALDDVGLARGTAAGAAGRQGGDGRGLLSVDRFPALARVTTLMLTVYFVLAVSASTSGRKDWSPGLVAAASMLDPLRAR